MTVTSFRPSMPVPQPEKTLPPTPWMADLGQEQYAIGMEAACTWFRTLETLCQTRQQAAHQALGAYEEAAKKLRASGNPATLLQTHADLLGFYLESPLQYWEQITATGMQTQIEMLARFNHLFVGNTKKQVEKAFVALQAAWPHGETSGELN